MKDACIVSTWEDKLVHGMGGVIGQLIGKSSLGYGWVSLLDYR